MIKVVKLTKIYVNGKEKVKALDSVSFNLPNKGFVFIVGKSGSGKSTLLNMLGGLDSITDGSISIDGLDIAHMSEKEANSLRNTYLSIIYQNYNLFEDESVIQNIKEGTDVLGHHEHSADINKLLSELDLEGVGDKKVRNLSGGQKQRVAIARALIKSPNLILADEPTGNLDSKTAKLTFEILKKISEERLVVVISHDNQSAVEYADRIIRLSDGRIVEDLVRNKNKKTSKDDSFVYIDEEDEISEEEIEKINEFIVEGKKLKKSQKTFVPHTKDEDEEPNQINFKKNHVNLKKTGKTALKVLKHSRFSAIVTSLLSIFMISLIALANTIVHFSGEAGINDVTELYGTKAVVMKKAYSITNKVTELKKEHLIETSEADIEPLKEIGYTGNAYPIYNIGLPFDGKVFTDYSAERYNDFGSFYAQAGLGVAQCKKEYLQIAFGEDFELLAGSLYDLENSTEVVFTDYMADSYLYYNPGLLGDDPNDPYSNILHNVQMNRYQIGAIVKTNYKENFKELLDFVRRYQDGLMSWNEYTYFVSTSSIYQKFEDELNSRLNIAYSFNPNFIEDYASTKNIAYLGNSFVSLRNDDSPDKYISANGVYFLPSSATEGNNVRVSSTLYNSLFGTSIKNTLSEGFEEKTIQIYNYGFDQDTSEKPKHSLKVAITEVEEAKESVVFANRELVKEIVPYTNFPYAYIFDNPKEAYFLHKTLVPQFYYTPLNAVESVFNTINVIHIFDGIFQGIFVLLIAIEVLIVVMHSFKTMKKEQYRIGVYKSLGYSNFYLTLAIVLANIIMMLAITVLSIGVSLAVSSIANYLIQNGFYYYTKYLIYYDLTIVTFRLDIVLIQCAITFGLLLLAMFIPFIKIKRTKVNNIIKEAE